MDQGSVRVTLLGEPARQVSGRIVDVSGEGVRLMLDEPAAPGAPLAIEWEDTQALGEVCCCEAAEGGFAASVRLEHVLLHTSELARLARKLLDEPAR